MNTFVIFLDNVPDKSLSREVIDAHVAYLRELDSQKRLVLAGPFTDYPSGMVVIRAVDKADAVRIAELDPFVKKGVRSYSIRTWLLATEQNNYLA